MPKAQRNEAPNNSPENDKRVLRRSIIAVAIVVVLAFLIVPKVIVSANYEKVPTSKAVQVIDGTDPIRQVTMTAGDQTIRIDMLDGKKYQSTYLEGQAEGLSKRLDSRVRAGSLKTWEGITSGDSFGIILLYMGLPILLLIFLVFYLSRSSAAGGMGNPLSFGKSKAQLIDPDMPQTKFSDVAGCEEAISELTEIRDFLSNPDKFRRVGARVPAGVLLYGPPGTGKTLLARAVAGEAGVPFYSISGSDFVEMFVGVGASRVRDLFAKAKENSPAIIFVDEIDAVGRHRGAGMGGGHDEREQTLNQLLVEMDGFNAKTNVILIAATNRPDVLDPALLRPGRFDRQIAVEAPDLNGRLQILKVHAVGKPLAESVDLSGVAQRTSGFTGADLANVLNEAALLTARYDLSLITDTEIDEAIDRVIGGPQRSTRQLDDRERLITAYHEGGHALVAAAMPGTDPVQKITILPRGRALGYTMVLPDNDKYSQTRGELLDQLAYMMGGRAAEELVFHDPTTGAANDIDKATTLARKMVTQFGMTEKLGAVKLGGDETSEPFMGMSATQNSRPYSDQTAAAIDDQVAEILENAHQEAFDTLVANRHILDELVRQLLERETLTKAEVAEIFKDLQRHPKRGAFTGSSRRVPSTVPPVTPSLPSRAE
ncbi:ATP-dependent zinc metalloprotease FtsH [Propionimicrobium lymphophilum]|uniref:ATP-dependent zinc metalloprotease FtsH n=1 Tax=Propionimicrobium lymphophilum TaxID=33012 RepID=UPI002551A422|nr:ATP-dependent zinc metalloprotease FtsH [Propionimicrobium lymphophilum]MDK7709418.1 ATP-dependent zinc metalloprotease FtsH [Propionimicrobium lymphophilum]MDK7733404.1 ATP-dependent zinc metalloprotease FtsH [Propionimicrobium lymphophilum]